jgi:hypothetical protein
MLNAIYNFVSIFPLGRGETLLWSSCESVYNSLFGIDRQGQFGICDSYSVFHLSFVEAVVGIQRLEVCNPADVFDYDGERRSFHRNKR